MILRQLTSLEDKRQFEVLLRGSRSKKGSRFREHHKSRISQIQLTFGRLYGLFSDIDTTYEYMLGGFCIHALDEFGECFSVPEVTYELRKYHPYATFEAGQLWSTDFDSALALRSGCSIVLSILHAQALLIYPVIIPRDASSFYPKFRRIGAPFSVPFAQTLKGESIWLQAMLLDGTELINEFDMVAKSGFETQDMHSVIRFKQNAIIKARHNLSDTQRVSMVPRYNDVQHEEGETRHSSKARAALPLIANTSLTNIARGAEAQIEVTS